MKVHLSRSLIEEPDPGHVHAETAVHEIGEPMENFRKIEGAGEQPPDLGQRGQVRDLPLDRRCEVPDLSGHLVERLAERPHLVGGASRERSEVPRGLPPNGLSPSGQRSPHSTRHEKPRQGGCSQHGDQRKDDGPYLPPESAL